MSVIVITLLKFYGWLVPCVIGKASSVLKSGRLPFTERLPRAGHCAVSSSSDQLLVQLWRRRRRSGLEAAVNRGA